MGSGNSETNSLDFNEFWANTNLDREVLRGKKLREEKPKCSREPDQFTPTDIHINGSVKKHKHRRGKHKNKHGSSTEKYRCPMRIAELAVPSKRQCLDTWRNRGKTLPNFMVDRLRQHVMDQRVVVHLNDAIHCFKSNKVRRSRKPKVNRRTADHNNYKAKLFCGFFGHRVVLKLLPSEQISLPSSLKNLTEIVNNDIEELLRRGKYTKVNKRIQNEISKKVTVWIASVIEDSDFTLMMDDLKDLEEAEGHVWDIIDDIMGIVAEKCKSKSMTNIGEKSVSRNSSFISIESSKSSLSLNTGDETSVYDDNINNERNIPTESNQFKFEMIDAFLSQILDSVCGYDHQITFVQNLLQNTISQVIVNAHSTNKIGTNNKNMTMPLVEKEPPEFKNVDEVDAVNELLSTIPDNKKESIAFDATDMPNSNLTSKLENQVRIENTETNKMDMDEPTYQSVLFKDTSSSNGADNILINQSKNSESDVDNTMEQIQSIEGAVDTAQTESTEDLSDALNHLTIIQTTPSIDNGLDTKISPENVQIHVDNVEEWTDDSLKKVKFSHTNIGNEQRSIDGDTKYSEDDGILQKKISSNSSRNYFKHINFSPPNANLLYKVDETWPEDFLPLTIKPSATISKSVISLGFINEGDETSILSPDTTKEREQNIEEQFVTELSKSSEEINKDSNDLQNTTLRDLSNTDWTIESKSEELYRTSRGNGSACLHIKRSHEMGDNRDTNVIITKEVSILKINRKLVINVLPCINIDSEVKQDKVLTKGKKIQTDAKKIKMKPNYKPVQQDERRIWCKGLYNVAINMEKWLNWLNSVTNIITVQLRKNDKNRDDFLKEWLQLKENIYSDAKLWHHLYKRLIIGINSFKKCYDDNNIKINSVQPKSCICRSF